MRKKIDEILRSEVIVFGTGSYSETICSHFPLNVKYFLDNNPLKCQGTFLQKKVFNPEVLLKEEKDELTILIASSAFEEIETQLSSMGFVKNIHFHRCDQLYNSIIISKWEKEGKKVSPPHNLKQNVVLDYAEKFSINILVETGTYLGHMVDVMKDYFKTIYSIELNDELYRNAVEKFSRNKNVSLFHEDSGVVLPNILEKIQSPCLFWLDGHYSGGITSKGKLNTPILQELKNILNHKFCDQHVILIDDARCFIGKDDYPTLEELEVFINKFGTNFEFDVCDDIIRVHKRLENLFN